MPAEPKVTYKGDNWGETPLWAVEYDGLTVDVHAIDESGARAAADAWLAVRAAPIVDPPGLTEAVAAVLSASDFETAKANLAALISDG